MKPFHLTIFLLSFISLSLSLKTNHHRVLQSSGDITLPSSSIDVTGLFTMYFDFEPTNDITMAIRFKIPDQYFSIGFGSRMDGTDMWVFELVGSQITARDHIGSGHSSPPLDTSRGGTNDLQVLGYEIGSSYSLVKVRRALNTGDPNDAVIGQGFTSIIYATGESRTMTMHVRAGRGHITIPLIQGVQTTIGGDASAAEGAKIEEAHSIANLVAWGILVDIGIVVLRLFKGTKLKIGKLVITVQLIHSVLMTAVIIMSVVTTALLLQSKRAEVGAQLSKIADRDFHFINGLITLALITMTLFLGILNTQVLKTYSKPIVSKYTVKTLHKVTGILLYLCAKANVITGALIYDEGSWRVGVFVYLGILFMSHIMIQIFLVHKSSTPNKVIETPVYTTNSALLEAINQGTPKHEIIARFPKLKWMTLGNRVYDLTDWIHPGGNFIIQGCIGREIGRYFFGNYALEGSKVQPHTHSSLTVSQMQKYCIGELSNLESVLVKKGTEIEAESLATNKWKIASITSMTETVSEVAFQCPDFGVKNFGKSLSWLGRHYKVSQDSNSSNARLYTTSFSLTKANFNLRQNIYKYFEEIMNGNKSAVFNYDKSYHASQDVLPLYIKDYPQFSQSFSHLIHTTKVDDHSNQFRVEGPFGQGLELSPNATGTHCIVCAGTGVLPFVDFLNLFLWKTMYDLIKKTAGVEKAESINVMKIPFDTLFNQMSISFFGAFSSPKEVLGLDIIAKLAELSKKYNLNNFNGMMKGYSDAHISEVKSHFSAEILKKGITTYEEKFYIVGPPKMNEDVMNSLEGLRISKDRIMLV